MTAGKTSLTIEGKPGEDVRVLYKGDKGDEPPPPVWEGVLGADGKVTIDVPQAQLLILGAGREAVVRQADAKPGAPVCLGAELKVGSGHE